MNIRRDCIHYHCEHEMGASIDCCSLKGLGKCPCSEDCAEYANRAEVYKMGLEAIKSKHTKHMIDERSTIEPEPQWIPFKRRKPTEEEGTAFDYIMDCKCPEDGQNILVSINIQGHEHVQYDTYYGGGGEECYLESGYDLVEEATAWMPLPEPYKEGES